MGGIGGGPCLGPSRGVDPSAPPLTARFAARLMEPAALAAPADGAGGGAMARRARAGGGAEGERKVHVRVGLGGVKDALPSRR